jgi:hypothetical protein
MVFHIDNKGYLCDSAGARLYWHEDGNYDTTQGTDGNPIKTAFVVDDEGYLCTSDGTGARLYWHKGNSYDTVQGIDGKPINVHDLPHNKKSGNYGVRTDKWIDNYADFIPKHILKDLDRILYSETDDKTDYVLNETNQQD